MNSKISPRYNKISAIVSVRSFRNISESQRRDSCTRHSHSYNDFEQLVSGGSQTLYFADGRTEMGSSADGHSLGGESDIDDSSLSIHEKGTTVDQLYALAIQAGPVIVSFFLSVSGSFINLVFAGNFQEGGSRIMAGMSLALMFSNVSCLSLLIGMGSALETLGSQYNGAKNYDDVGVAFWRCIMILSIMVVPIGFLWYYSGNLFGLLGIEPDVCEVISTYIRIHILTLPVDVFNVSYENYLIAIGVMEPSMWAEATVNIGVLILNLLFVYQFKLGYECLAWSWVIAVYCSGVVHFALSWNYPAVQRTLRPWTWKALSDWGDFISLGLPGTIMLCSEWWAYEVLVLFASVLGTQEVAAQSIILQAASLAFMIPCGLGEAATSLVGNALGAQKNSLAIHLSKLSLFAILLLELVLAALVLFLGKYFINICTPDEVVRKMASGSLLFLAVFAVVDGLQGVAAGILKGAGQQAICAFFNVVSFYVIGLPMAYFFCFHTPLRVNGLMMGIAVGASFQVSVSLFLIFWRESEVFKPTIHKVLSTGSMSSSVSDDNHTSTSTPTSTISSFSGGSVRGSPLLPLPLPSPATTTAASAYSSSSAGSYSGSNKHGSNVLRGSGDNRYTELIPIFDANCDIEKASSFYNSINGNAVKIEHSRLLAAAGH